MTQALPSQALQPAVTLAEVTADNWELVADLEVAEAERAFIASNIYSLAQSKFEPRARPLAICAGGTPVGFMMFEADDDEPGSVMLYRFMIDHRHRGHGYGRAGLQLLIDGFERNPETCVLKVCFVPDNVSARRLYASLGFIERGHDDDGEIIAVRSLQNGPAD
jgi:diamine N-acetyltransferase